MEEKNIYWLCGDRFVCIERKKQIIETLQDKEDIDVEDLTGLNGTEVYSEMNKDYLFGLNKTIYVYDGEIPDINLLEGFLQKLPKSKYLIIINAAIDGKKAVDKRKTLYKKFNQFIEEYVPVIQDGFPDKKLIPKALGMIKSVSGWSGSEEVLADIFKWSGYDYGSALQEIAKYYIYYDKIESLKERDSIVCKNEVLDTDDLLNYIIAGKHTLAIEMAKDILDSVNIEEDFMQIVLSLEEHFSFLAHCCLAQEHGKKTPDDISDFVAETWIKNGKKNNSQSVKKRLFFYRDRMIRTRSNSVFLAITEAENAVDCFIGKRGNPRYLFNRFVARSCCFFI